jgi:hypothetical protein
VASLLGNRMWPITNQIGFVKVDPEMLVDWFIHARADEPLRSRRIEGNLEHLLSALAPLTTHRHSRYLFVPTSGEWTAFFSNGWRGTDSMMTVARASQAFATIGLRLIYQERTTQGNEERVFELYGPEPTDRLTMVRRVGVVRDVGRWTFSNFGTPLAFEQVDRYDAKLRPNRFTAEMLEEYALAFGVRPFDESFYAPEGWATLVEDLKPRAPLEREMSIDEVQRSEL